MHATSPVRPIDATMVLPLETAERLLERSITNQTCQFVEQHRYAEAFTLFRRWHAYVTDPEHKAFCSLTLGRLAEKKKDYRTALDIYLDGLRMEPRNEETWYHLHNNAGRTLNVLHQYEAAESYCRKAIAINPDRYHAYKNLGICLAHLQQHHEARSALKRGFQQLADNPAQAGTAVQREQSSISAFIQSEDEAIELLPPMRSTR